GINPLPIQRPIPVWIGGSAEVALRRAAVLGDGFFPQKPLEGGWAPTLSRMRAWREAAGKSWRGFGIEARLNAAGGPEQWRKSFEEWRSLGATHISVNTMGAGLHGVDEHLRLLREVREAVG
ncbi:MAG TPA: LLM class F420-dependent oxidoreductase, partial [Candidatus Xenobia bacterium]